MPRKQRSDSVAEAVRYATADDVSPPSNVPLAKEDLPFFANVIDEFARADWTAHQLELAAMLARDMCDLNREQQLLRTEGFIAVRENGTTVENPRARAVKSIKGDILSLRRSLQLHARARGEAREKAKRTRDGLDAQGDPNDDDLLARPN